mgnify:CR=1 FL=1
MNTEKLNLFQMIVIGFAIYGAYELYINLTKTKQRFYPMPERQYAKPIYFQQAARFNDITHKIQPFREYPIRDRRSCAPYC